MRIGRSIRFALLVLVGIVVVDRALTLLLDVAYRSDRLGQTGGQINRYLARGRPDVLVIGSSRAHHAIDPERLASNAYNLSHNGMNVVFQAGLVDILGAKDALPEQLLILQLEPEDLVAGDDALRHMQFLKYYYGRAPYITSVIDGLRWSEPLKYLAAGYRFNGSALTVPLNAIKSLRSMGPFDDGYEPLPVRPEDSAAVRLTVERAVREAAASSDPVPPDALASPAGMALAKIRSICEGRGIRLVVFTAPYFDLPVQRRALHDQIGPALRKAGYTYIDYTLADMGTLRSIRYWVDNDHVNAQGARLLTDRLRTDLDGIGALPRTVPPATGTE